MYTITIQYTSRYRMGRESNCKEFYDLGTLLPAIKNRERNVISEKLLSDTEILEDIT